MHLFHTALITFADLIIPYEVYFFQISEIRRPDGVLTVSESHTSMLEVNSYLRSDHL